VTGIQAELVRLWGELLRVDTLSIEDSFLELGGDSFFVVHVASFVEAKYQVNIPLVEFFDYRTVALLAREIERRARDEGRQI